MAIEPVKVPTDIQIEEKIIGPVSLRQIFLLLITGGSSYILWSTVGAQPGASIPVKILCWLPFMIGIAFAFVKIHDVSLFRLLLLNIEKLEKPSVRAFGPRPGITINVRIDPHAQEKRPLTKEGAPEKQLQELSTVLDTGVEGAEEEMQATEPKTSRWSRPVDARKITASPKTADEQRVDGITPAASRTARTNGSIVRDLSPTPAEE